jgi:hypothetical protein
MMGLRGKRFEIKIVEFKNDDFIIFTTNHANYDLVECRGY